MGADSGYGLAYEVDGPEHLTKEEEIRKVVRMGLG